MVTVFMINNKPILVDSDDIDYLNLYDMHLDQQGYVICKPKKKYKKMGLFSSISLHKLLLCPEKMGRDVAIDHINGNRLDNRKSNLRICTHQENMRNRKVTTIYADKPTTSKYKGLTWRKQLQKWQVYISIDKGNRVFIGCFENEVAAANCYNYYAKHYHGDFARLNNVPFMSIEEWESYRSKKRKSSEFRGVSYHDGKWIAQIYHESKQRVIGRYNSEISAARAYNEWAIRLKGNKAKLNVI